VVGLYLRQRFVTRAGLQQRPFDLERAPLHPPPRFRERAHLADTRLLGAGRGRELAAHAVEIGAARRQLAVDVGASLLQGRILGAQLVELARDLFGTALEGGGTIARLDLTGDMIDQGILGALERRLYAAERGTRRLPRRPPVCGGRAEPPAPLRRRRAGRI